MSTQPIIDVPIDDNILQSTAEFVFKHCIDSGTNHSPDITLSSEALNLSSYFVLLPSPQAVEQFIPALYASIPTKISAIIPPWSGTLKNWAKNFTVNPEPNNQIITNHARQLLFIEALQRHPALFKEENQWQVAQALLDLFDDLSLNQQQLFTSAEEWQDQLQQAYGLDDKNQHLLHESKLVHTLWHAWQQQLKDSQLTDESADYISRLQNAASALEQPCHFICVGYSQYSRVEQEFLQSLVTKNQCQIIDYATDEKISDNNIKHAENQQNSFHHFVTQAFSSESAPLRHRAIHFSKQHTNGVPLPFSTYLATSDEEQVCAIDFFVRQNLLERKNNIAIISEDRKLSRRLRALLERASVPLNDKAGWSLATTQASTVVERWLECIEEDFSAYPLLDCLKSPFVKITDGTTTTDDFQKNIYRLEHDIIFHENIASNIEQYKNHLKNRLNRLSHWPQNSYKELINTLNFIQNSAKGLSALRATDKKILLSDFFSTLLNSLDKLGVLVEYKNDEAGLRLLETFEHLKQSLNHADPLLSWQDCRVWLGLALESEHFTPPTTRSAVQLMTLEQAAYLNFDCIIIAATESQHFPGSPASSPFFNQAVRASLELTTWEKQSKQRKALFKQTLLSAPTVLLTACKEENGEEKPVSPWLELLIHFYQLAFNTSTENKSLTELVQSQLAHPQQTHLQQVHSQQEASTNNNADDEAFNVIYNEGELPDIASPVTSPLPADLVPERISASAYQRLINCPYQYFAADGLQLKPLEEIADELKKSDYGERIHLILQCFHNGHDKYGKAFEPLISSENKAQAEEFLATLSEKIFLQDMEDNILHRSWLYRWQKHIPAYISWQIKHQLDWRIFESEKKLDVDLGTNNVMIVGRLDRIDKNRQDNSQAIIDYKTGKCANQEDVDIGENIQLSTYALLDKDASTVSYLSLDSSYQKVETKAFLSGDNLNKNREQNEQRLTELFQQMHKQESLPAWGDDHVCRYCNFSGLCRKQEWME